MVMQKYKQRCVKQWHRLVRQSFFIWQRLGVHAVPNHFYQPIPDTRYLPDGIWDRRSHLVGIDLNESGQLLLLSDFEKNYKSEYDCWPLNRTTVPHQYYLKNNTFEAVDAEVLYSMIRHKKPSRVYEIGSGFSTMLAAQALLKNQEETGKVCEFVAIEPYPNEILKSGIPGLSRLVQRHVQDMPLSTWQELQENDILFIDSSHVLKIGSDVQYEYLEILPRLKKGVLVHIHDIFLPAEYPRDWLLKQLRFWNEQYLLQAFLSFNDTFEVVWAGSYMHLNHPDKLAAAFKSYAPMQNWPGSFWIHRVK